MLLVWLNQNFWKLTMEDSRETLRNVSISELEELVFTFAFFNSCMVLTDLPDCCLCPVLGAALEVSSGYNL
jgi:hypothetical protein